MIRRRFRDAGLVLAYHNIVPAGEQVAGERSLHLMEERFAATLKLAQMPRNSSATRIRNRCEMSGRPRSNYRKNKLSRIALRELGSKGLVPGLVKSSW